MTESKRDRLNREIRELEEVQRFASSQAVNSWILRRQEQIVNSMCAAFAENIVNREDKVRYLSAELVTLEDFKKWIASTEKTKASKEKQREELNNE